jgi:hypothetical protein
MEGETKKIIKLKLVCFRTIKKIIHENAVYLKNKKPTSASQKKKTLLFTFSKSIVFLWAAGVHSIIIIVV